MRAVLVAAIASLATLTPAPPAKQISIDPFSNRPGQHETAVEPDSFAFGRTVVSVFQVGRIVDGGASGIGWATSVDGGESWRSGVLPGLTTTRVSDPVVAYDRVHGVWLAASLALALREDVAAPPLSSIVVSRSRDGLSWSNPVVVAPAEDTFNHDKPWVVCDNGSSSAFAGRCYATWTTRPGNAGILAVAASTDGGATWSSAAAVSQARGSGWQPVTRPDGELVIPYEGEREINAVTSRDGGRTFGASDRVATLRAAAVPGMRAPALPSAEADEAGRIYVAWQDSRFRGGRVNDIVVASSSNGRTWTRVRRVPTWPDLDGLTHFVPGLAAGAGRIAIAFYVLRPEGVAPMFVSSPDGGRTWSEPHTLATPQPATAYPLSNGGRFLGDYISTSFADAGAAVPTFAAASAPFDGRFHQGVFATRIPPLASRGALLRLGAPKVARAGRRVTVSIPVRGPARPLRVACTPRAGLVATRVTRTAALCTWRLRSGVRVRGMATVFSGEEEATRRFTFRALAAASAQVGKQRALVILATWGPQPWTRDEVVSAFDEAARFYAKSSFGQLELTADVTPWLSGYPEQPACPVPEHERIPTALTNGPEAAAEAAGFRTAAYDRVVYVVPKTACSWLGVGVGRQVMLNGSMNTYGFVHELGHTYGLAHARGRPCGGCRVEEYGDPFSPMGRGLVDFSAYEKVQLGWLRETVQISRRGTFPLGRPDVLSATPHAAVVKTGAGEYWLEQRLDVERPGLVVRTIEPDVPDDDLAPSTLFHGEPTARGRATVALGETFRVPGVFSVQYGDGLTFAWLDRTRPARPRVSVGSGRVSWRARDAGSGIGSCDVSLDGRPLVRGSTEHSTTLPRVARGQHRVSVTCVDRAGNRSRATVKRIRVR